MKKPEKTLVLTPEFYWVKDRKCTALEDLTGQKIGLKSSQQQNLKRSRLFTSDLA